MFVQLILFENFLHRAGNALLFWCAICCCCWVISMPLTKHSCCLFASRSYITTLLPCFVCSCHFMQACVWLKIHIGFNSLFVFFIAFPPVLCIVVVVAPIFVCILCPASCIVAAPISIFVRMLWLYQILGECSFWSLLNLCWYHTVLWYPVFDILPSKIPNHLFTDHFSIFSTGKMELSPPPFWTVNPAAPE